MFPLNLQKCRTFLLLRQYMQFIHFSKSLFCIWRRLEHVFKSLQSHPTFLAQIGRWISHLTKFDKGVPAGDATWVEFLGGESLCARRRRKKDCGGKTSDGYRERMHTHSSTFLQQKKHWCNFYLSFYLLGFLASLDQMARVEVSDWAAFQRKGNSFERTFDNCSKFSFWPVVG